MGSDDAFRAGDADRERAVEVIREAYVSGRLDLAEFQERTAAAFTGRTWGDLRKLTSDLPTGDFGPAPASRTSGPAPTAGVTGGAFPAPVLPIALVWLVAMVSMRSPGALIPIVFFLIVAVRSAVRLRGCDRRRRAQPRQDERTRPGGPG